jgi:hypothetical protein
MLVYDKKTAEYLKTNTAVDQFIKQVDSTIETHYKTNLISLPMPMIKVEVLNKFIRIWCDTSCWGFISRVDAAHKGASIKKGDLLKPASWKAPAKHARGNIVDATARWGIYGPEYIK